jgi:hypothetical protein
MNTDQHEILLDVQRRILRIERNLVTLNRKSTWLSATWVTDLTGWDGEKMRQARVQNIIEYRRKKTGGYEYKLESIPEIFIIKKQPV